MHLTQVLSLRPKAKIWKGEPFTHIEHKLDGHRVTIVVGRETTQAFGRKVDIDIWPDIKDCGDLEKVVAGLPANTVVDGELLSSTGFACDVKTSIEDKSARYHAFSLPQYFNETDIQSDYGRMRAVLGNHGFDLVDCAAPSGILMKPCYVTSVEMLKYINEHNLEGLILKQKAYSNWYKIKPEKTIDCIVSAVYPGVGKYEGMLGSLSIMLADGSDMGNISGFSDSERKEFWAIRKELPGRVVEVKYETITKLGKLKYGGTFYRWRDDKPKEECVR